MKKTKCKWCGKTVLKCDYCGGPVNGRVWCADKTISRRERHYCSEKCVVNAFTVQGWKPAKANPHC